MSGALPTQLARQLRANFFRRLRSLVLRLRNSIRMLCDLPPPTEHIENTIAERRHNLRFLQSWLHDTRQLMLRIHMRELTHPGM